MRVAAPEPVVAWPPRRDPPVAVAPPVPQPEREEEPPAIAPSSPPAPRSGYEERAPGVRVREGESQGLGYLEVVLGGTDPEAPLPMIVVIHGRGDRPRVPGGPFEGLTRPVRVIMPRGPMILGEGFGWLPVRVLDGRVELLAAGLRDMSARLARLIEELRGRLPTLGPTIVSGFSQGGMLAITIAVRWPTTIGLALPLAGWLPPPLWPDGGPPERAAPIRAMHAADDERIPYEPTRESYERLRTAGWDLEYTTFLGAGHTMSPDMDATFHAWLERALDAIWRGDARLVEAPPPQEQIQGETPRPRVRARPRARSERRRSPPRRRSRPRRRR